MLVVWGVLFGFLYASLPSALFGAALASYVRRELSRGGPERPLRAQAILGGAALGATFGAAIGSLARLGGPMPLYVIAGLLSGAICGSVITSIVKSDDSAN